MLKYTLGIESTCDETGCGIVRFGREVLASEIASQIEVHRRYGGVVPELSARLHIDWLFPLVEQALEKAQLTLGEIELVAAAYGPGLVGALHVGLQFAKGLALGLGRPFIGVNHVAAHLYTPWMQREVPPLPAIGVVVSGAHTALLLMSSLDHYTLLGQTQDDAVGEAFDKVARLLGLPYPGGPHVEELAKEGDPLRYRFKAGKMAGRPLDFSYSGLKTAVLYQLKESCSRADVAASFQQAALLPIVEKASAAAHQFHAKSIVVGGGVSHNKMLRSLFASHCKVPVYFPPPGLSLDNGAMIAGLGAYLFSKRGGDRLDLSATPRIPL